jgi:hypothetical protein
MRRMAGVIYLSLFNHLHHKLLTIGRCIRALERDLIWEDNALTERPRLPCNRQGYWECSSSFVQSLSNLLSTQESSNDMAETSESYAISEPRDGETVPQVGGESAWHCCGGSASAYTDPNLDVNNSPDVDFHADSLIKLTHGVTAYRIIDPKNVGSRALDTIPIIVCLHGLLSASYMWGDIADLLSDFEQGPQARVLVFDFYGRGRSPWTGVDITLDTLVTQTKELMDGMGLPCENYLHI